MKTKINFHFLSVFIMCLSACLVGIGTEKLFADEFQVTVTGRILYHNTVSNADLPLRHAKIEVWDSDVPTASTVLDDFMNADFTDDNGNFLITGSGGDGYNYSWSRPDVYIRVSLEDNTGQVRLIDEFNGTQSYIIGLHEFDDVQGMVNIGERILDTGKQPFFGTKAMVWVGSRDAYDNYVVNAGELPPAGFYSIQYWSGVYAGTPWTNLNTTHWPIGYWNGDDTYTHEFAHSVRHSFDGDQNHFNNDVIQYGYIRGHIPSDKTNEAYAFNEGWAEFWEGSSASTYGDPTDMEIEGNVAHELNKISNSLPNKKWDMLRVLKENPEKIHSFREFCTYANNDYPNSCIGVGLGVIRSAEYITSHQISYSDYKKEAASHIEKQTALMNDIRSQLEKANGEAKAITFIDCEKVDCYLAFQKIIAPFLLKMQIETNEVIIAAMNDHLAQYDNVQSMMQNGTIGNWYLEEKARLRKEYLGIISKNLKLAIAAAKDRHVKSDPFRSGIEDLKENLNLVIKYLKNEKDIVPSKFEPVLAFDETPKKNLAAFKYDSEKYYKRSPASREKWQRLLIPYSIELTSATNRIYDPASDHWVPAPTIVISSGMNLNYTLHNPHAQTKAGYIACKVDDDYINQKNEIKIMSPGSDTTGSFHISNLSAGNHTITLYYMTDVVYTPDWHGGKIETATTAVEAPFFFSPSCEWSLVVKKIKERLLTNQKYDLGDEVSQDVSTDTRLHFQQFQNAENKNSNDTNSVEMDLDGTIYIACNPIKSPYWYDPYYAYDKHINPGFKILSHCPNNGSIWKSYDLDKNGSIMGLPLIVGPSSGPTDLECIGTAAVNTNNNITTFFLKQHDGQWQAITELPSPNSFWISYRLIEQPNGDNSKMEVVEGPTNSSPAIIDDKTFFISLVVDDPKSSCFLINGKENFDYLKWNNFSSGSWPSPALSFPNNQGPLPRWYKLELPTSAKISDNYTCDWVNFLENGDGNSDDLSRLIKRGTTPLDSSKCQLYSQSPFHISASLFFMFFFLSGWPAASGIPDVCGSFDVGDVQKAFLHEGGCSEWQTILPIGNNFGEKKNKDGVSYSWDMIVNDAQENEFELKEHLNWNGHPDNDDRSNPISWVTSQVQGTIVNSWLSGDDYKGDHAAKPDGYWLGNLLPSPFTDGEGTTYNTVGTTQSDWCLFIDPDPEYEFLRGGFVGPTNGNFEATFLPSEIETWCIPTDYRPEPGDRALIGGRWIVDVGHDDYHTEIHPIELLVSTNIHSDTAISKVVVTGAWSGGSMQFEIWPPARPSANFILHKKIVTDVADGFTTISVEPVPHTDPNHFLVTLDAPLQPNHTGQMGQVDYNAGLRLASKYKLWWSDPKLFYAVRPFNAKAEIYTKALLTSSQMIKSFGLFSIDGDWQYQLTSDDALKTVWKGKINLQDLNGITGTMYFNDGLHYTVTGIFSETKLQLKRDTKQHTIQNYDLTKKDSHHFSGTYKNEGEYKDSGTIEIFR